MNRRALITGITGQDGRYLQSQLQQLGYVVAGHTRRKSLASALTRGVHFFDFDLCSIDDWRDTLNVFQPDEIYHLAGMSFVPDCWETPDKAISINVQAVVGCLEAIRLESPQCRMFAASSSEIFRGGGETRIVETSKICPVNLYGVTKASSFWALDAYRRQYDLFAVNGIFFNHESPCRPLQFVTRKISSSVASIAMGVQRELVLGDLNVQRDWGYAPEYVNCAHKMLSAEQPHDFVIGSGRLVRLESLVEAAFSCVGLDWREFVRQDAKFMRGWDSKSIYANTSKAKELLGWEAETTIEEVMVKMVEADLAQLQSGSVRSA